MTAAIPFPYTHESDLLGLELDEVLSDTAGWLAEDWGAHEQAVANAVEPSNRADDRTSSRRLNDRLKAERRLVLHVKRRHNARGEA